MKSFEERLEIESSGWVTDGLIDEAQRGRLLARHPVRTGGARRFLAALALIGGVLVVVGISLVIKSNWEDIGDWVKIVGLLTLLAGTAVAGWRLKVAPGHHPRSGEVCLMASSILFLLGIVLVSQIYHLDRRPADGVLMWWIGIVALPWIARAEGAQLVSVVAGLTWFGMELGASDSWLRLADDLNAPPAGFLFAAAGILVGAGLFKFGRGLRGGAREGMAALHEILGLVLMNGALYALGFNWSVYEWDLPMPPAARWQPVAVLVLLLVAAAAWRGARKFRGARLLAWSFAAALVPAGAFLLGIDLHDSGWLWGGLACVVWFLLDLGLINAGLAEGNAAWINLGIGCIALNIVTRYFLLFGTLLQGGVFFIVTGLLVLGLGYYLERKRRALVGLARKEVTS